MNRPRFAPAAMSAYHWSASRSVPRGEKTADVTAFHGFGGAELAATFAVR